MSYQVFARKYRPKTFADVLGQDHVVRTLRNAIAQNRLAHAYLFVGPRGTGKTSTARIFAKALNCLEGPSVDFDPEHEICVEIAEGRSLDVLEIDGASNNGVDQVRDLRESVKYAPSRCRYKIYYIDEVHMLSTAAFNALLKTLEEPPPHVKFIFATTEANKILPTIISRCQRFDLRRIPNPIIAKHLLHIASLEGVDLDERAAYAIGKGAEGGMRDAQSMLDQLVAFCGNTIREQDVLDIFGFTSQQAVAQMALNILESDTVGALRLVHENSEAGKDLGRMLGDLIQHFRTLLVYQADATAGTEDLEPDIAEQVAFQSSLGTTDQLLRIVDGLAEVDARMRWATNKRLHFELGVIQAVQHFNEVSISDVIEALDGGTPGGLPRPAPRPAPLPRVAAPASAPRPNPASAATPAPATPAHKEEPHVTPSVATPPSESVAQRQTPEAPAEPLPAQVTPPAAPAAIQPAPAPAPEPEPVAPAEEKSPARASTQAPVAARPAPAKPAPPAEAPPPAMTNEEFRLELVEQVQQRRPLVAPWLAATTVLSMNRGVIKLGFPATETHAKESLNRDNQRAFLEGLAEEILGTAMRFELVVDASLKPPPATELHFSFEEPVAAPRPTAAAPAPVSAPKAESPAKPAPVAEKPQAQAPAKAVETSASTSAAPAPTPASIEADFQNDPLIRSAIEKFKLKLAARAAPAAG